MLTIKQEFYPGHPRLNTYLLELQKFNIVYKYEYFSDRVPSQSKILLSIDAKNETELYLIYGIYHVCINK